VINFGINALLQFNFPAILITCKCFCAAQSELMMLLLGRLSNGATHSELMLNERNQKRIKSNSQKCHHNPLALKQKFMIMIMMYCN